MGPKDVDGIANSVDPDQTAQSDLALHCLLRSACLKTYDPTPWAKWATSQENLSLGFSTR